MSIAPSALAIEQSNSIDILRMCRAGCVPANVDLGAAIAAHRTAFRQANDSPDETDRQLAAYVLRAVIFASTKTREQRQQQIDYLTKLPIEAWSRMASMEPEAVREEVLAMCAWWMTRMEADT